MSTVTLRTHLPLLPENAEVVSPDLAVVRGGAMFVLFNASGAIYQCRQDDEVGVRLGVCLAVDLGLAPVTELATVCGLHRATLHRDHAKLEAAGVEAVRPKKRGPKGPHKLVPKVLAEAQHRLDAGDSLREVGRSVGVSEFAVRWAIKKGLLRRRSAGMTGPTVARTKDVADEELARPSERAAEDQACEDGVAVKRTNERVLARFGKLPEAPPSFEASEAVPGAGVLLALPALLEQGLLEENAHVQFVFGVKNALPARRQILDFFLSELAEVLPKATWCAAGIGRHQFEVNKWCLQLGGHCRTGLEDNIRLSRNQLAGSNAELVQRVVEAADDYHRRPATCQEARALLGLIPKEIMIDS